MESDFIEKIKERAKKNPQKIVLAEGEEPRVIEAAHRILSEKIAELIILGNEEKIKSSGFDLSRAQIINPQKSEKLEELANAYFELRKNKGITREQALKTVKDPLYFGVMLVHLGYADGLVAGAIHSTAVVLRAPLQIIKSAPGVKTVSSFFVMDVPDKSFGEGGTFLFADCAVNSCPSSEQLAEIAVSSAKSFKLFVDKKPKVALLSYSSRGSAGGEYVEKVSEAAEIAKKMEPELIIDGELQADAAIVPEVASLKTPGSVLGGRANVLVFPNLDTGNIAYKLVQRLSGGSAYGPITQGMRKPVNDLSRGCAPGDIVGVVAITAVQAQSMTENPAT